MEVKSKQLYLGSRESFLLPRLGGFLSTRGQPSHLLSSKDGLISVDASEIIMLSRGKEGRSDIALFISLWSSSVSEREARQLMRCNRLLILFSLPLLVSSRDDSWFVPFSSLTACI